MGVFPKGLLHGFGQKLAIFHHFSLGKIGQEHVIREILEWKNAFLTMKTRS